ncbi:protein phosphatase 2C [Gonapodya prolifera JEL478]|uniref:protein-serine/threonine phosphatase n=1 Tax=Gonapodya prolifera (strain JEL478) TaxID=1344416 RepID=A0A139ANK3_GONPJ|nr:protein phosphatase 2C [Gonapodya prolifera JEL478]|eukprot:KXS18075.1 protein phosphatase 2C [Gonapodya prolifera JEL478]
MGQTLSEPVRDKHTSEELDPKSAYGASSMQGWRISMEDAHTTILRLPNRAPPFGNSATTMFDAKLHHSFYGVFDGHGGASVAQYAGKRLHWKVAQQEEFAKGDFETALKKGFLSIDDELRDDPDFQNDPSGCTAVVAIVTDDDVIYVANAGDSRCVLCSDGKAVAMSEDHKPGNPDESARIMRGGGFVEYGRVNGNLALSRALGDFEFKQNPSLPPEEQVVTAFPDVVARKVTPSDEFLVLACDGIWDVLDNQQVCDFVSRAVSEQKPLGVVCEDLMDRCLAPDRRASELGGIGCDNMTVVVVALLKGKSFAQW